MLNPNLKSLVPVKAGDEFSEAVSQPPNSLIFLAYYVSYDKIILMRFPEVPFVL